MYFIILVVKSCHHEQCILRFAQPRDFISTALFHTTGKMAFRGLILLFHDYIMFRSLIPLFLVIGIGQVPRFLIWLGCMYMKILEGSKVPKREGAEAADVDIKAKKKLFSYTRSPFIHRSTLFHYRHGRRWN